MQKGVAYGRLYKLIKQWRKASPKYQVGKIFHKCADELEDLMTVKKKEGKCESMTQKPKSD